MSFKIILITGILLSFLGYLFYKKSIKNPLVYIFIIMTFLFIHQLYFLPFTLDDTYITLRYAQNFSQGYGLVFNIGERVEGYSNFLWVIVLGVLMKFGFSGLELAKFLGIIFSLTNLFILFKIYQLIYKKNSFLPLVFLATNSLYAMSSVEGLETSLLNFLLLLSVYFYLLEEGNGKYSGVSAIPLSLLALTRPEGIMFFLVALFHKFIYKKKFNKKEFFWILIFFLIFLPYFFWRLNFYQSFLPNTFYVKKGGNIELIFKGLEEALKFVQIQGGFFFLIFALVPFLIKGFTFSKTIILFFIIIRIFFNIWSGGAWVGYLRFWIPLIPLIYILISQGLEEFFSSLKIKKNIFYFIIAIILFFNLSNSLTLYSRGETYKKGVDAQISLGKWLKKQGKNNLVALTDIGATSYFSGLKIIDMDGLVDRKIAEFKLKGQNEKIASYVLDRKPDYIILTSKSEGKFIANRTFEKDIYGNKNFQNNYNFVKIFKCHNDWYILVYNRKNGN